MTICTLVNLAKWQTEAHRALDYPLHLLLPDLSLGVMLLYPKEFEGGLLLNLVVGESLAILEMTQTFDEMVMIRWDALPFLDLGFHTLNCV